MCELTVFGETDNSFPISDLDRSERKMPQHPVSCRGSAFSSSADPVIANGDPTLSRSAMASASSAAWFAARGSPSWR
jgi:hypothetical protein